MKQKPAKDEVFDMQTFQDLQAKSSREADSFAKRAL